MSIRSMILALAVGCFVAGCVTEDSSAEETGTVTEQIITPWQCTNVSSGCSCVGGISIIPVINVDVKNVRVLNNVELNALNDSLNNLAILSGNEINVEKILTDVELTVLEKFLNDFVIAVTKNDINVCAVAVLGGLICK